MDKYYTICTALNQQATLVILNHRGQIISESNTELIRGNNVSYVKTNSLADGLYFTNLCAE
jgi:hypothetical protein